MTKIILSLIAISLFHCDTYRYETLPESNTALAPEPRPTISTTEMKKDIMLEDHAELQGSTKCPNIKNTSGPLTLEFTAFPALTQAQTTSNFYTKCSATYYINFKNAPELDFSKFNSLTINADYIFKSYVNYDESNKVGLYIDNVEIGLVNDGIEYSLGVIGGFDISLNTNRLNNKPIKKKFIGTFNARQSSKLYIKIASYYRNLNIDINQSSNNLEYFTSENSTISINSLQLGN